MICVVIAHPYLKFERKNFVRSCFNTNLVAVARTDLNKQCFQNMYWIHRHIRKIDCLMTYTACLVCLVSTVSGCCKNAPGRGSASSRHI